MEKRFSELRGISQEAHRNLDGVYVRMLDDQGRFTNVCLSDMTQDQREAWLTQRVSDPPRLIGIIHHLAEIIRKLGDQFNLVKVYGDDENEEAVGEVAAGTTD